jgi:hypothetical protein
VGPVATVVEQHPSKNKKPDNARELLWKAIIVGFWFSGLPFLENPQI